MTDASPTIVCSNPDCRVAETDKCVEGLARDKCPRYGQVPSSVAPPPSRPKSLTLPLGDRLDTKQAPEVLRANDTRVVAVLGARDAGKTSLIAGLYGLLQEGPIGEFCFSGSRTLRAFEEACHDARSSSNRQQPHFERTHRGVLGFYHTTLLPSGRTPLELLIADRAGEEYLEVADDVSRAKGFAEVVRADVVTLLVDGRRLLDSTGRHNLRSELEMILQALKDGEVVTPSQRLAVVLTKLDEVECSPNKTRAESDLERLTRSIRGLFGGVFKTIETFRVAASPTSDILSRGHGLPELLAFWMHPSAAQSAVFSSASRPARAFGRLTPKAV